MQTRGNDRMKTLIADAESSANVSTAAAGKALTPRRQDAKTQAGPHPQKSFAPLRLCAFAFLFFSSLVAPSLAQTNFPLHFYARPYRVAEGDAVLFLYREDLSSIKRTNIVSFKWDYDNDGSWDLTGTTNGLNQTWYATYRATGTQTVNGVFMPWPRLQVTYNAAGSTNLVTTNIVGMTEEIGRAHV